MTSQMKWAFVITFCLSFFIFCCVVLKIWVGKHPSKNTQTPEENAVGLYSNCTHISPDTNDARSFCQEQAEKEAGTGMP